MKKRTTIHWNDINLWQQNSRHNLIFWKKYSHSPSSSSLTLEIPCFRLPISFIHLKSTLISPVVFWTSEHDSDWSEISDLKCQQSICQDRVNHPFYLTLSLCLPLIALVIRDVMGLRWLNVAVDIWWFHTTGLPGKKRWCKIFFSPITSPHSLIYTRNRTPYC